MTTTVDLPVTLSIDEGAERVLAGFRAPTEGVALTWQEAQALGKRLFELSTSLKAKVQVKRAKEQMDRLRAAEAETDPT